MARKAHSNHGGVRYAGRGRHAKINFSPSCAGLSRASTSLRSSKSKNVDDRIKSGHDEGRKRQAPCSPKPPTYDELYRNFRWDIPARFNMATACCDRHADGTGRLALIYVDEDGATTRSSFDEVAEMSRRFANVLKADGLVRGDRVAVFLSQSLELPIAHLAAFRSGDDLDPAVCAVRRGCAGIPSVEFRKPGRSLLTRAAGRSWRKSATGFLRCRTST